MKVSSVFLPGPGCISISLITIATCPVQIAMAQHHHRHANYNNHQSNIDATDIYSRSSSGKTNADAIDTILLHSSTPLIATQRVWTTQPHCFLQ